MTIRRPNQNAFLFMGRILGSDGKKEGNIPPIRKFFEDKGWALFSLSIALGLACGLLSGLFVFKWNEWASPSFGLFVTPVALSGWAAAKPKKAALIGLAAMLAGALGHFLGAQFNEYDQNNLEYPAWVGIALFLGPLLGYLGFTVRSRKALSRAVATGIIIGLLCAPFYFSTRLDMSYFAEYTNLYTRLFDALSAILFFVLCRGVAARGLTLVFSACFIWLSGPMMLVLSVILWRGGGGI